MNFILTSDFNCIRRVPTVYGGALCVSIASPTHRPAVRPYSRDLFSVYVFHVGRRFCLRADVLTSRRFRRSSAQDVLTTEPSQSPPLSPNFPERQTVRTFSDRPSGKAEPKVNAVPPIDRTYVHGASRLLKIILSI